MTVCKDKKHKERKRMGDFTGSRNTWGDINPVTKVDRNKKRYTRTQKHHTDYRNRQED